MQLIQSNCLDALADLLAEALRTSELGPFEQPLIVVPSTLMERWLTLALADRLGFVANIRFELPAVCAWRLIAAVLPEVPAESPLTSSHLKWRLMDGLDRPNAAAAFAPVRQYLEGRDVVARYRLAGELAECFENYAAYRPDWLEVWAAGKSGGLDGDARWQAGLWRDLIRSLPQVSMEYPGRAFLARLARDASARALLPPSISLFAHEALAPPYLEIFAGVAKYTRTSLYLVNPCREYWTDLARPRSAGRGPSTSIQAALMENQLLAGLGQHLKPLIETLIEKDITGPEAWRVPEAASLLATLRRGVLELWDRDPDGVYSWDISDRSIEIHDCHSAMREAEVLHDALLDRFDADATLAPEEVVVYVCEPRYAATLNAVFGAAPERRRIPYVCYPDRAQEEPPLARSVRRILAVAGGRGAAPDVVALLDEPALAGRFDLDGVEGDQLNEWIRRAGIHWGWDDWSWREHGVPAQRQYTWVAGLERLVLGAALSDQSVDPIAGISPAHAFEGSELQVLAALHELTAELAAVARELRVPRPIGKWMDLIEGIIDRFHEEARFPPEDAQALRALMLEIARGAEAADYVEPVPFEVASAELELALARGRIRRGGLAGGVRIVPLAAGHIVPARVVCIVGANDGVLPRRSYRPSFDLIERHPRKGDRHPRDEDRHAFLAAVLAARDALVITFTGRSARDNAMLLPSSCVVELREAVARATGLGLPEVERRLHVLHPLQPFSPLCFSSEAGRGSYADEWFRAAEQAAPGPFLENVFLPVDAESFSLSVEDIQRFFRHPARFFFQRRLGLFLPQPEDELSPHEPFTLSGLEAYRLREEMVHAALESKDASDVERRALGAGKLPPGPWGHAVFAREAQQAHRIAGEVVARAASAPQENRVDIRLDHLRLLGAPAWPPDGPTILWRTGKLRAQDRLRAWILHLVRHATAEGCAGETLFIAESVLRLRPLRFDQSRGILRELLGWVIAGLSTALPFYPETSLAFASAETKRPGSGAGSAARVWEGDTYGSAGDNEPAQGEQADPYYALATRGRDPLDKMFEKVARAIFDPFLAAAVESRL